MNQKTLLSRLYAKNSKAIIVSSLGTISYDLEELVKKNTGKGPLIVPIKGAMGAALGCGLGMALYRKEKVIVVIGDGSFLMKLGSLSTILRYRPRNLEVIVLDNGCYKSCGGQKTNFRFIKRYIPKYVKVYRVS